MRETKSELVVTKSSEVNSHHLEFRRKLEVEKSDYHISVTVTIFCSLFVYFFLFSVLHLQIPFDSLWVFLQCILFFFVYRSKIGFLIYSRPIKKHLLYLNCIQAVVLLFPHRTFQELFSDMRDFIFSQLWSVLTEDIILLVQGCDLQELVQWSLCSARVGVQKESSSS